MRKIFSNFEEEFNGKPLYETLLVPTKLYYKDVFKLKENLEISGIAHITGGGLIENVPRIIPDGLCAKMDTSKIKIPEIMLELEKRGNINRTEMFGTFNMGVGMVIVVDESLVEKALPLIEDAYLVGEIVENSEKIVLM